MAYKDPNDPRAAESRRKHYERNKERYKASAKAATERLKQEIRDIKESSPCTDCGAFYPYYVMHFDHIRDDKVDSVSRLVCKGSSSKVREELNKCELVCANCHAFRTFARMNPTA